ncbi:hypothetical protein M501DRAFT_991536 [Patellaria atrata CBS 101060]|uniref:Uncharacterized protein n=1 Tax=Patellaria atrata CBS 101060 TaxID=1346257 RepID=A0A9P4VRL1_9PEZI|nr:hypothetical protein M501DRAFT_991536 [Patellaria atrata CBS 101060]
MSQNVDMRKAKRETRRLMKLNARFVGSRGKCDNNNKYLFEGQACFYRLHAVSAFKMVLIKVPYGWDNLYGEWFWLFWRIGELQRVQRWEEKGGRRCAGKKMRRGPNFVAKGSFEVQDAAAI